MEEKGGFLSEWKFVLHVRKKNMESVYLCTLKNYMRCLQEVDARVLKSVFLSDAFDLFRYCTGQVLWAFLYILRMQEVLHE